MDPLLIESSWEIGKSIEIGKIIDLSVPSVKMIVHNGSEATEVLITGYEADQIINHLKKEFEL